MRLKFIKKELFHRRSGYGNVDGHQHGFTVEFDGRDGRALLCKISHISYMLKETYGILDKMDYVAGQEAVEALRGELENLQNLDLTSLNQ